MREQQHMGGTQVAARKSAIRWRWVTASSIVVSVVCLIVLCNFTTYAACQLSIHRPPGNPAVQATNDAVYFTSFGKAGWGVRLTDGKPIWQDTTFAYEFSPVSNGRDIYYAVKTPTSGIIARSLDSGAQLWQVTLPQNAYADTLILTPTGLVGFIFNTYTVELDAWDLVDGRLLWSHPLPDEARAGSVIGQPDGKLIIYNTYTVSGALDAATGKSVWEAPLPDANFRVMTTLASNDAVYLAGNDVSSMQPELFEERAASGAVAWQAKLGQTAHFIPELVGDALYTMEGEDLVARDAQNGAIRWRKTVDMFGQ